jgi:glucokinase
VTTADAGRLALGVDIGGTKIATAVVDQRGHVVARERGAVDPTGNEAGLASIFAVVDRLLEAHPDLRGQITGIGAGTPGSIDWRTGTMGGATNLSWRQLPIAQALSERYGVPALLDNDVNVAAWGEAAFGGEQHLVFITVGTGIGSGLVEAGRIVRGRRAAGEIGHIPILENGPRCRCGMIGCLEGAAAGPAFTAAGQHAARLGEAPGLLALAGGNPDAIDAALIVRAAQEGDPAAQRLLDREGYYLALAVLIAGRMLDPEVVVIGGGLSEAGPPLFEALWSNLARIRSRGPEPRTYAIPARLGPDAGTIGAAALILRPEAGFVEAGLIAP